MLNFFFKPLLSRDDTIVLDRPGRTVHFNAHRFPLFGVLIAVLVIAALVAQYSAGSWRYAVAHALKWAVAFLATWVVSRFPLKTLLNYSGFFYALFLILLLYVHALGWVSKGAQRWIDLGVVHLEPSEFFKIILPLFLTQRLHKQTWGPKALLESACIILPPCLLIIKQPDLGTGLLVFMLGMVTLLAAGLPWWWLCAPLLPLSILAPYWWSLLHTYQKNRILNLIYPEHDPLGTGYHILQSMIAVGSGGFWGKGLSQNTQSQLAYLPEHATDFVFALWAEEWGFIGSFFLLSLFLSLSLWLIYRAYECKKKSAAMLLQVVGTQIALSSMINVGMVLGLLPVVGVPLPIMSLGGSNALMNGISFGIAAACLKRINIERSFS